MTLCAQEQHVIATIDQQVKALKRQQATPQTLVLTLRDWIPETRCLIDHAETKALDLYLSTYPHFAWFAQLISRDER